MKNGIICKILSASIFVVVALTSCQPAPSTPEVEAAKDKVKEAEQELKAAEKVATADEWMAFKKESEEKIAINENSIADLKDRMSMSAKQYDALYIEKIDKLEKQNKALKARIKNHDSRESRKEDWATFKTEFNHDIDELGQALKDLTVDNKK